MALVIWCGANGSDIRKVFAHTIATSEVAHRVEPDLTCIPTLNEGDVLLACGGKALAVLIAHAKAPKGRTITSLRNKPLGGTCGNIFVTFDPQVVDRDYARLPDIQWDAQLAIRKHNTGSVSPPLGEYRYVDSLHELIERIDYLYEKTGRPVPVSADLETLGLDEYDHEAWIIAVSFTVDEGKSDVVYFDRGEAPTPPPPWLKEEEWSYWQGLWVQLHWLFTSPKIALRGANFKYDSRWISHKWAIEVTNLRMDTMLVGSLLNENRSNSLKLHAKLFTPMGGYEDDMKSRYNMARLDLAPPGELLPYVGGDTDATHRVGTVFKAELAKDKKLLHFYVNLLHPSSKTFERMERTGVLVDMPYYVKLQTELESEIARLDVEMKKLVPRKLAIKYQDNFSLTRPALLREFLFSPAGLNLKPTMFTEKEKEPSTSGDHLMTFEDDPAAAKFIGLMRESNSAAKTLSTYVVGFLKHLRSDGRFHPHYRLARGGFDGGSKDEGAVTGRCLVGSSLISTGRGLIPIQEVVVGDLVLTHRNRWRPVTGTYKNGFKEVFTVKTKDRSLTCTGNHPIMSFPTWKLAEDLQPGDVAYVEVMLPPTEKWKLVDGWPFEVSNFGRVRRATDGRNVKAGDLVAQRPKGAWGHVKVTLTKFANGRKKVDFPVHRLVCQAFHGLPPAGKPEVSHLNGVPTCNWATNLKWVSVEENRRYMTLHGTADHSSQKKLDWAQVDTIRTSGESWLELAKDHGVSRELVRDVKLYKRWVGRRESIVGFAPVEIDQEVISAGFQETFDLSVEGDHSFVANGMVVHNTSASDPAVQTIPKRTAWTKRLRRAFIAPPGQTIVSIDYSQGELKITACLANEPVMIQAYLDGADLHAITAAQLNGYSLQEFKELPDEYRDELRSGGKAGNFGLIYGMQPPGFVNYAYTSYGVKMTLQEAETKRNAFFGLYTRLLPWHDEYKAIARRTGVVRSPLGRVRHLPLIKSPDREARSQAERQAINSPVQSCLSDMMQLAMTMIDNEYGPHAGAKMFLMTHDSCAFYVPIEDAEEWARRLTRVMDTLPLKQMFGWDHQLPFTTDAEVALPDADGVYSLATLKKLKLPK